MLVVPDLALACDVCVVRGFARDFIPHGAEVHADAGVVLDKILEFLENGNQLLLADLVDVFDMVAEPVLDDAVVCGQPCSRPDFVRNQPIMYKDMYAYLCTRYSSGIRWWSPCW